MSLYYPELFFIARIYGNNNLRLKLMPLINKLTAIKYVLSYVTIHQAVSVASATILRVSYKNTYNTQFHKMRN